MTQQTDHYFNDTINKKENIEEDKECYKKLQIKPSAKKAVLKRKDYFFQKNWKRVKTKSMVKIRKNFPSLGIP